ncbi:amino acid ABC transporter, ATP-binding protein [Candidatus Vecturithrix granuli]|uniref:Amino acid ABC transporter, ATP-binding protein n=1 Tax=Vecturithrix granuli TaxID=1499967 RepID=A0A081C7Y5_VECG1|nr:amino acid ABC transporter, ATP-binding protein [Candidatus Vecturithrix granuli]
MLHIEDIHVYRGHTYVLKGVSLRIAQGEIVALIGANGAGKTTLLRTISGLLHPRTGAMHYMLGADQPSHDLTRAVPEHLVQLGISHCPEGRGIFSQLSVKENLLVGAYLRRDKEAIQADYHHICELFPILAERSKQAAGSLSGGEQEMLAVGRALMSRPKLLLLDEPSLGLSPIVIEKLFETLIDINAQGVTILLVEQNAVMALDLAHRAYVLETGRITLTGTGQELANNDAVRQAYLGGV